MTEEAQEAPVEAPETEEQESVEETVDESQETEETADGSQDAEENQEGEEKEGEEEPKTFKLTINGHEEELTLEQLQSLAQKAGGADQKFMEAAKERKRIEGVLEKLKSSPFEVLQKLGLDPKDISEKYLTEIYTKESLPEEQRKLLEMQEQVKKLEKEKTDIQKAEQEKLVSMEAEKQREKYDYEISTALEKTTLPKTPNTIARVANYLLQGLQEGIDVPVDKAVALVEEDFKTESKSLYENMEAEKLAKVLGPDLIKKLKGYDLSQINTPEDKNRVKQAIPPKSNRKSKKKTWAEIQKELDDLTGPI